MFAVVVTTTERACWVATVTSRALSFLMTSASVLKVSRESTVMKVLIFLQLTFMLKNERLIVWFVVDECAGITCSGHGSCHVIDGSATCVCWADRWSGSNCEVEQCVDVRVTCLNGGSCRCATYIYLNLV